MKRFVVRVQSESFEGFESVCRSGGFHRFHKSRPNRNSLAFWLGSNRMRANFISFFSRNIETVRRSFRRWLLNDLSSIPPTSVTFSWMFAGIQLEIIPNRISAFSKICAISTCAYLSIQYVNGTQRHCCCVVCAFTVDSNRFHSGSCVVNVPRLKTPLVVVLGVVVSVLLAKFKFNKWQLNEHTQTPSRLISPLPLSNKLASPPLRSWCFLGIHPHNI